MIFSLVWYPYETGKANKNVPERNVQQSPGRCPGVSSGCGWRAWPPDVQGSCEYMEQVVADSRHGVVLHVGRWAR